MYDGKQQIKVRWNNTNKDWYMSKGYEFTKRNDEFYVNAEDLSSHSSAKIKVICDYCKNEYETQFALITSGRKNLNKDACPHCAATKAKEINHNKRAKKKFDLLRKICEENNYELITKESEFTNVKMKVKFRCKKHGVQEMMLDNLVRGHLCRDCSYEKRKEQMKNDINNVKSKIESINHNVWLNPTEYKNAVSHNLKIKCSCGKEFTTSYVNYTKHDVTQCFSCSNKMSTAEIIIKDFLESQNISFIQEYRFNDCRDKKPLPFDFYLSDYNLIIEFDGQHHYFPIRGESNHLKTKKHDIIKDEYCQSHGIHLLRIPYWNGHEIENIISEKIKNIGKRYSLVS